MPFTVACQCGAKFAAQDHLAGKVVRCPKCSQPLQIVPAETDDPAPSAPLRSPRTEAAPSSAAPAAASQPVEPTPQPASAQPLEGILDELGMATIRGVRCPNCSADTHPEAVICVSCGYNLKRGRQQAVASDSRATQRHQAILERQRLAGEKHAKQRNTVQRTGGTQTDLGGVPEATTAILIYPTETFTRLSPVGGTWAAFEYATTAAMFIGLFWFAYYSVFFFIMPMAAYIAQPDQGRAILEQFNELLPLYGKAAAMFAGAYALSIAVSLGAVTPAMAGGAHLVLKFIGETKLGYLATLRVLVYTAGASFVLAGLPCIQVITPITWLVGTTIGFTVHHRVAPGIGFLAVIFAVLFGLLAGIAIHAFLGTMIAVLFVLLAPPAA